MTDPINPTHYSDLGQYSAIHVATKWGATPAQSHVLKYIQRNGRKPGVDALEDLQKALWYAQWEIDQLLIEKWGSQCLNEHLIVKDMGGNIVFREQECNQCEKNGGE